MAGLARAPEYARRLITALLLGSVAVAVYGLAQYVGLDPLPWITDSVSPVLSTLGRSNFLGAYLAMVIPFTLSRLAVCAAPGSRLRYGLVLALQAACLFLTMARGAWLGLVAGCAVFLGLLAYRWQSRRMLAAAGSALLVGAVLLAAMDRLPQLLQGRAQVANLSRASELSLPELRSISVETRAVIWEGTLALIPRRWPLGYGPGTFEGVFAAHYPPKLAQLAGPGLVIDDPHNLLLDQLVAAGAAGVLAFLTLVAVFFWRAGRTFCRVTGRPNQAVLAAILGSATAFLIQAQFNPDVIVLAVLFWLCMAMAVGAEGWG
jgi:putative inorganic carbon (HCO3(-)) transporter